MAIVVPVGGWLFREKTKISGAVWLVQSFSEVAIYFEFCSSKTYCLIERFTLSVAFSNNVNKHTLYHWLQLKEVKMPLHIYTHSKNVSNKPEVEVEWVNLFYEESSWPVASRNIPQVNTQQLVHVQSWPVEWHPAARDGSQPCRLSPGISLCWGFVHSVHTLIH